VKGNAMRFQILILLALALGVVTLVGPPVAAETTAQAAPPAFVFASARDGDSDVYVRRTDGSAVKLTRNRIGEGDPAWSPDGRKIAFARDVAGGTALFVMNADGSHVRQLTRPVTGPEGIASQDGMPTWSPDGRRIAFSSFFRTRALANIWRVDSDGTHLTRLTRTLTFDRNPAWSPDGRRIWFDSDRADPGSGINRELFTMRPDGTNIRRITHTAAYAEDGPDVSPDGRRVVFSRSPAGAEEAEELFTMRPDGSQVHRLGSGTRFHAEFWPQWTADGTQVLYQDLSSARDVANQIWRIDADGTNRGRISSDRFETAQPDPYPVRRR